MGENDGTVEMKYVAEDPSHLILWKDGEMILGHAIWHESTTYEHRKGVPRDQEEKRLLKELLGGKPSQIAGGFAPAKGLREPHSGGS